jgi:hypothetical protein
LRVSGPLRARGRPAESGYALLLVVFFTAMLLVGTMLVAPRVVIQGRREKETEMVWRGKQYVRGVKLYYRKLGRFPTSLDDLTKPQVGSLHFMRQAYKDPMNKKDGAWRLIYVGPAGNLIGSLKPQQTGVQFPGAPGLGTPASAIGGGLNTQPGQSGGLGLGSFGTQPQGGAPGLPPAGTAGSSTAGQANGTNGTANGQNDPMATPPPDSGSQTVIGGNIIGVGSNVDQKSLRVYEKAKNYKLFEFIWDPSKDTAAAIQAGTQPGTVPGGTGIGGQPIGQPMGGPGGTQPSPTGPGFPTPTPQQPAPAPQQQ